MSKQSEVNNFKKGNKKECKEWMQDLAGQIHEKEYNLWSIKDMLKPYRSKLLCNLSSNNLSIFFIKSW